ncbi:hypothetical protein GC176_21710 [bacterium]|nr:hypothetical protein [bacterium]
MTTLAVSQPTVAQLAPGIGYMFPPGGRPGETVDVVLGGYDWTPDMQLFPLDQQVTLETVGPPGPVIVPEPPYWFDKKARRPPFLLPRETRARLTIPSDVPPGVHKWQVANANGASTTGRFAVVEHTHFVEPDQRGDLVQLPALPVTVSGQIKHIEEVDRYQFRVEKSDLVTISTLARILNSDLNAVIEVRDESGRLIADAADTAGVDTSLTFAAEAGRPYTLSIYDLDFRGNRAFVYQVSLTTGPRILATIPAAGRRGETRSVEFVGYGLTGKTATLESVRRDVTFPVGSDGDSLAYSFEASTGEATSVTFALSDIAELVEPDPTAPLALPLSVTGTLDQRYGEDSFLVPGTKGDVWSISVASARTGSPLDVSIAVFDSTGKELQRSDDESGTTDAAIEFRVPSDGEYRLVVADTSGRSGDRSATYRLQAHAATPGFRFATPELLNASIGKPTKLAVNVVRSGGLTAPIRVSISGLPNGVTVPDELVIPEKKNDLSVEFTVAEDAAATATLITIRGETLPVEGQSDATPISQVAEPLLLATTITPPFSVDAEGKDDVAKWPRGTTFPYPVLIERNESFNGEIVLEMTSRQGRHRQGITGPELTVLPGVQRILYPIFLPEWLETTRTSRMVVNGVTQVPDPQGNVRYSVVRQKTRMGFLPTGALLKLSADKAEFAVQPGQSLTIPLSIGRAQELTEPALIELLPNASGVTAESLTVQAKQERAMFTLTVPATLPPGAERSLTIRATVLKDDHLPTVSQTGVLLISRQ